MAEAKQEPRLSFKGLLGSGRFGSVHLLVADASSKIQVARKYFYDAKHAEREIQRWISVRGSTHIIEVRSRGFDVPSVPVSDCNGTEYRHKLQYIDFPFMAYGSLAGILDSRFHSACCEKLTYDNEVAFSWVNCILHALHFLHDQCKLVHCDVKPDNILIGDDMLAKLSDMGSVKQFQTPLLQKEVVLPGTLAYMPPETLATGQVSAQLDMWSLGIVMFELAAGHLPWKMFRIALTEEIKRTLITKSVLPNVDKWEGFIPSREYHAIMMACCNPELTLRPLTSQLLQLQCIRIWQPKANPNQRNFHPFPPIVSEFNNSERVRQLSDKLAVSSSELETERSTNKQLIAELAKSKQEILESNTVLNEQTHQMALQSRRIADLEKFERKLKKTKRAIRRFASSYAPEKKFGTVMEVADEYEAPADVVFTEPHTSDHASTSSNNIIASLFKAAREEEDELEQEAANYDGEDQDSAFASTTAPTKLAKRQRQDENISACVNGPNDDHTGLTAEQELPAAVPKSKCRKPAMLDDIKCVPLSAEQEQTNLRFVSEVFQPNKRLIAEKVAKNECLSMLEAEAMQELVAFNVKKCDMGEAFTRQLSSNGIKMRQYLNRCGSSKLTMKWTVRENYYIFLVFLFSYDFSEKRVAQPIEPLARIDLLCRSERSFEHKKVELAKKLMAVLEPEKNVK